MTTPSSGTFWFSDINVELNQSSSASIYLGDTNVRSLFGVGSGYITMADGRGKSSVQYWVSKMAMSLSGSILSVLWTCKPHIASDGSIYIGGAVNDGSAYPRGFVMYITAGGGFGYAKKLVPLSGYNFNTSVYAVTGAYGAFGIIHGDYSSGNYDDSAYAWTAYNPQSSYNGGVFMSTKIRNTQGGSGYTFGSRVATDNSDYTTIIPWYQINYSTGNIGGMVRPTIFSSSGVGGAYRFGTNAMNQVVSSSFTSNTLWAFGTNHQTIQNGPYSTVNGSIYSVSTLNGGIYARRFSDSTANASIWAVAGGSGFTLQSIAASANVLYIAGTNPGASYNTLVALETSNGMIRWARTMPSSLSNTTWAPPISVWSNSTVAGVSWAMEPSMMFSNSIHGTSVVSFNEANGAIFTAKTFHYANTQVKLSPIAMRTVSDKTILVMGHNTAQGSADGNTSAPVAIRFSTWSNADITAANGALSIGGQSMYINAVSNASAYLYANGNYSMSTQSAVNLANGNLDTNNNAINNSFISQTFLDITTANTYLKIL